MMLAKLRYLVTFVAFAAVTTFTTGCGDSKGSLSGKVSFNGKVVKSGTVQVIDAAGVSKTARIGPDGTYAIADIGTGSVKIGVSCPNPKAEYDNLVAMAKTEEMKNAIPPLDPEAVKNWFALPLSAESPDESGLSTTLKSGANTFDIALTGTADSTPQPKGAPPAPRASKKGK